MFDDIEKHIRIFLSIQRRPTRNALAGRGSGRNARSDTKTRMFAEDAAAYTNRVYHFHDKGRRIELKEIIDVIFEVLRAMPDEILKRYADKLGLITQPAIDEIAAQIHLALSQKWAISYHPCTQPLPPSSYVPS